MISKDIIRLNNEMREKLTEENKKIYEDMLVYIRLNAKKSEQDTEEVLLEILEHLLEAQSADKTAYDVFGDDLKQYCDELIAEIPGEKQSKTLLFGSYLVFYFLGIIGILYGVISYAIYQFFQKGSNEFTFSLGSGITIVLIDLVLLFIFVKLVLKWMKSTMFRKKQVKKWVEFFQIWLICTAYIGISLAGSIFMPDFGVPITIPVIYIAGIGVILYIVSVILNKKYRLTK
ncbi:DUF1129 family protein [Ornithinibacillus contaminans]|uniref:DUF1129 family protein n=1 Tax=Ornithinibacillus contaminans TaxID=694055 RepID=UPI00064DF46C|nr:DUF1129 family protein [Ornithinibacillus contaminans]